MRSLNALLILSPLAPSLLEPQACAQVATALRAQGVQRADITMDPRTNEHRSTHYGRSAMSDFFRVADGLSMRIMRPVVGRSDLCDLKPQAIDEASIRLPNLEILSAAGKVFVQKPLFGTQKLPEHAVDARHLGLIFYLALHGRTQDEQPYSKIIFPDMTPRACEALSILSGNLFSGRLEPYGPLLDLDAVRMQMIVLQQRNVDSNTFQPPRLLS